MSQGRVMVLGALVALLGFAAPAQGGTYRVWTCQGPDGKPAPISDSSSGWISSERIETKGNLFLEDRCASGGGIYALLAGTQPKIAGGAWSFMPPAGTSLGGFNVTWSGTGRAYGEATLSRSDQPDPTYVERNMTGDFPSHSVAQGGFGIAALSAIVACSFAAECGPDAAMFSITRAVMTLNDDAAPKATGVSGDLVSAPTLRGRMNVSFAATDTGGGLYRVVVTADGKDAAAAVIPDAAGRCAQADPRDTYSFKWPRPCALEARTTVAVDTARLPEGPRWIGVVLEDAAGNRTPLAAPAVRTVVHRGASNGGDGAVVKRRGRYTITTSFAKRRATLRGTLTRQGAPVAGALLDVLARNGVPGATFAKLAEVRTDAKGEYRIKVPAGPSRVLRVAHRAYLGDANYASWSDVSQRVRARVDFRARTKRVGLRGRARFSGAVRGGFVPRRGKLIELQAYDAGRWRTFRTVRTRSSGRFDATYSFRHVNRSRTYRFRARARYERSYPFLLGTSRIARVRVG